MNLHTFTETFFNLEKELNLFEKKIKDVYFWKIIRFNIFMDLARKLNIYEQAHSTIKYTKFQRKLYNYKKIYNTQRHSYISRKNPVDILIFEHPRKVNIEGIYKDIYTYKKIEEFQKNNQSYEIVDRTYLDKHYDKPSKNRSYYEDYGFKYIKLRKATNFTLNEEEKETIKDLTTKIKNAFDIELSLEKYIESVVRGFTLRKRIIKDALEKRKVKKVYLVVSYGHEVLISACEDLNIECIEIQHGTMSYYHPGYSFPHNNTVPYFPDKIELFGEYWLDATPIPLRKEQCPIVGYHYLKQQLNKYININKISNQILFLSQGTIGKKLSEYAYKFAITNPKYNIFFKLHPGEFGRWENGYPSLQEAKKLHNFTILEDEKNLYELLAISSYVFGVYSTAIYEALESNCKVFLLDLDGVEYNKYLYDNLYVIKIKINEYNFNYIKKFAIKPCHKGFFFHDIKKALSE
ncbi:hypothetical protein Q6A83_05790 [Aliarcobacter skirrowii]|uniref:hypothetical protein n=1 Tax=Aliarcobacter skirrowii TaxID=28200 RepID=UPI0029A40B00|nr:hypothetical protein [Aliarcobacter skirrowii]MDX4050284.1 hypothetical protein [Aliarcobacter skirrowii]